jgi:hypothetical protein
MLRVEIFLNAAICAEVIVLFGTTRIMIYGVQPPYVRARDSGDTSDRGIGRQPATRCLLQRLCRPCVVNNPTITPTPTFSPTCPRTLPCWHRESCSWPDPMSASGREGLRPLWVANGPVGYRRKSDIRSCAVEPLVRSRGKRRPE